MKDKILLYQRRFKSFITKKRKFPLAIYVNLNIIPFLTKNERELRRQISNLSRDNKSLKKEIKRLKVIIELRDMEVSLDKLGDY